MKSHRFLKFSSTGLLFLGLSFPFGTQIIRSNRQKGAVTLIATAKGLTAGQVRITLK